MERPLVASAVCLLSGVVLGEAWTYYPLTTLGVMGVGGGVIYKRFRRQWNHWVFLAVLGLVLIGMIRLQIATRTDSSDDLARFATREPVRLIGVIDEPLRHGPESSLVFVAARGIVRGGDEVPVRGRVRITVRDLVPDLEYGDSISAGLRLRPASGLRNPGGFDYAAVLRRDGIRALATVHRPGEITRLSTGGLAPLRRIYAWRERIRQRLDGALSPVSSAILQAMLIGETGSLTPEIREAFMISGTTHLLSISGSHLALVAFVVFHLAGRILRRMPARWLLFLSRRVTLTRLAVLTTLVPVVFYTLLAGGQVATVRSLVMILVYLAAVWFQRADDPLNALAVAALLIVSWDPRAVFAISFQLSFIAVLAMALIGMKGVGGPTEPASRVESEPSRAERLFKKLRAYWGMTVAAGAATLPLTAFYFNQIGWVGFLSNPIVIPIIGMVIVPLGLVCSIGAILFDSTTLPLAGLNDGLVRGLYRILEGFARLPASELHVPSPPAPVLAAFYIAGWIGLSPRPGRVWKGAVISLWLLIITVWIAGLWTGHSDGRLRVTFLDVGQGDAAWIEMPDGKTILIDGGSAHGNFDLGRLVVAPYLWDRGHWRIDTLVASHPQRDHMGGLIYIARKFRIGEVWTNGLEKNADFYDRFREMILEKGIPEKRITGDGLPKPFGPARITTLHPAVGTDLKSVPSRLSDNDQSLVIRIEYGREALLFTGDIERPAQRKLLRWGGRLKATVLKVPHHGSRSSIDPDFLSQTAPAAAVISVGANNPYRHPSPETLAAYDSLGARLYRTDRDGAVRYETDGIRRTLGTQADLAPRPVPWGWGMTAVEGSNLKKLFSRGGAARLDKG
ncbi:MAG: DNA internalization-related competence protein ComEC/Rec2 [Nitrospirae bacterium]|nr:DNA internalization-related competence protein ComEC/Rec2 [Nitrospirota bacterium]